MTEEYNKPAIIKVSQGKNKVNRVIANFAEEIQDAWLNIGKHDPDDKDPKLEAGK